MAIPMDGLRRGRVAIVMIAATACATASGPARQVHSSVHVESQARADSAAQKPLDDRPPAVPASVPRLPDARPPALSQTPERRIKLLDVPPGTPIDQAVTQVATQLGLGVSIDPEVRGTTSGTLRNITLDSALAELVGRRGYAYQVQASVVRVAPIRMETRTFTLDYMALSRVGTMSTVIQRRFSSGHANALQSNGLNAPAAGANTFAAPDADVLMAQPVADIWQEIRVALTGLLHAGQSVSAGSRSPTTIAIADPPNASASAGSNAATSVAFPDGAALVVSPISGLISVTAMPDQLRAVEAFIDEFQTSVLRQVAIEAKIVEVTLSTGFPFGIDWTQIDTDSKNAFTLRSDPTIQTTGNVGSVYYTLSNGPAQIGAVLTALESQGRVTVLSNEKTTALNNQRAIFNVTTDEVFFHVTRTPLLGPNGTVVSFQNQVTPQQISVGVVLDVFPQISADNVLTMDIRPAVTNITRFDSISLPDGTATTAPVIARREGDTIARIRAGETMVIGGLVQTRKEVTRGGVPILKDVPLLGKLFERSKSVDARSELVIFLTPTILAGALATGGGR